MVLKDWEGSVNRQFDEVAELLSLDRELLEGFFNYLVKERELRGRSVTTYSGSLLNFARWWHKPLEQFTKQDGIDYKHYVREKFEGADLQLYGSRVFLKWKECRHDDELLWDKHYLPEIARGLRLYKKAQNHNGKYVRETPVLKTSEVNKLIEVASNQEWAKLGERDVVLIGLLYATGFRKGELQSMRVKDLFLEDGHWFARCPDSKTIPRKVRLYWGEEFAELWKGVRLNQGGKPDDALFQSYTGKRFNTLDYTLRNIVKKAPRHIRDKFEMSGKLAHLFRHSRACVLAHEWRDPWRLRDYFGWSNMAMASLYVSKSKDGEAEAEPEEVEPPQSKVCDSCGFKTVLNPNFCPNCGTILNEEAAKQKREDDLGSLIDRIANDPRFWQTMSEKVSAEKSDMLETQRKVEIIRQEAEKRKGDLDPELWGKLEAMGREFLDDYEFREKMTARIAELEAKLQTLSG